MSNDAPTPIQHEIFPDGCVSLIYHRNENFNIRNLALNHLNLESIKVPVFAGDVFWGMRISPAAAAKVLGLNPKIFQEENHQKLGLAPHLTENLSEKLDDCCNFAEAIEIYEDRLGTPANFKRPTCRTPENRNSRKYSCIRRIDQAIGSSIW